MNNFISNLEKGELHVHLNGLISTTTIQEIIIYNAQAEKSDVANVIEVK
jgi:hypothetical protein